VNRQIGRGTDVLGLAAKRVKKRDSGKKQNSSCVKGGKFAEPQNNKTGT